MRINEWVIIVWPWPSMLPTRRKRVQPSLEIKEGAYVARLKIALFVYEGLQPSTIESTTAPKTTTDSGPTRPRVQKVRGKGSHPKSMTEHGKSGLRSHVHDNATDQSAQYTTNNIINQVTSTKHITKQFNVATYNVRTLNDTTTASTQNILNKFEQIVTDCD